VKEQENFDFSKSYSLSLGETEINHIYPFTNNLAIIGIFVIIIGFLSLSSLKEIFFVNVQLNEEINGLLIFMGGLR